MQVQPTMLLPLLAVILGGALHSMSDDGAASILDHFGIKWRMSPSVLAFAIFADGIASGAVDRVVSGSTWGQASILAACASFATVFGAGVNHALVNKTPAASNEPETVKLTTKEAPKDPPPPAAPKASALAGVATLVMLMGALGGAASLTSCKDPQVASDVTLALNASQLACIESSKITDSQAVAIACEIDAGLVPVIDQLLAQKAAAAKQGFAWDAGADASKASK